MLMKHESSFKSLNQAVRSFFYVTYLYHSVCFMTAHFFKKTIIIDY